MSKWIAVLWMVFRDFRKTVDTNEISPRERQHTLVTFSYSTSDAISTSEFEGSSFLMDLSTRFGLDELRRFVLTVKKNYRDVPYHNWTHAFAVAHSMYLVIRSGNDKFTALEVRVIQFVL